MVVESCEGTSLIRVIKCQPRVLLPVALFISCLVVQWSVDRVIGPAMAARQQAAITPLRGCRESGNYGKPAGRKQCQDASGRIGGGNGKARGHPLFVPVGDAPLQQPRAITLEFGRWRVTQLLQRQQQVVGGAVRV